jgi:hypothetical protein
MKQNTQFRQDLSPRLFLLHRIDCELLLRRIGNIDCNLNCQYTYNIDQFKLQQVLNLWATSVCDWSKWEQTRVMKKIMQKEYLSCMVAGNTPYYSKQHIYLNLPGKSSPPFLRISMNQDLRVQRLSELPKIWQTVVRQLMG